VSDEEEIPASIKARKEAAGFCGPRRLSGCGRTDASAKKLAAFEVATACAVLAFSEGRRRRRYLS